MKLPLSPQDLIEMVGMLSGHGEDKDEEEEVGEAGNRRECGFVALSDLHLGATGFRSVEFLQFIKYVKMDQLVIDGDFIDLMMMGRCRWLHWFVDLIKMHRPERSEWYFPAEHARVIQKLLRLAYKGTEIVVVPGNHDKRLRTEVRRALQFGIIPHIGDNIAFVPLHLHVTKRGERFLILHGDEFDGQHAFSQFWEVLGSHGYNITRGIDVGVNSVLPLVGLPEIQISAWCKSWVKGLIQSYAQNFGKKVAEVAQKYKVDGIIFGHTHTPMDAVINGVRVINLGAWTEAPPAGCTALIEDMDGELALVQWKNGKLYKFATREEIPPGKIRFGAPAETARVQQIPVLA